LLLYYITDRKQFPGSEENRRALLLEKISEAARSGVDYIQLREKDLTGRELEVLAREAAPLVMKESSQTRLLINSRTDVALAARAHGVHLRSSDILPAEVREIWRQAGGEGQPVVAVSCHTESEVIAAEKSGAEFVVFGPVFEKAGKEGTGLSSMRTSVTHKIPVLALGGVTFENACACLDAGAAGIAGIRLFQEGDVAKAVAQLRSTAKERDSGKS
jgi:thiamine-phosphate pyrophosphorylase